MRLLLGTNNKGKAMEMQEVLSGLGLEFLSPESLGIMEVPEERGSTYAENALLKAQHFFRRSALPTIADDSGIVVDALPNELGVLTRRWGAGHEASDEEWIAHFLKRMELETNRRARLICNLAYVTDVGTELFEGVCEGEITHTIEAPYLPGLPVSGCFKPLGNADVYSTMSIEQKSSTSHRGKALKLFREFLTKKAS